MSLDHRIKKGLQSPTIKVDLALVMVVVRDDHNKFISKCNHVRRNRNSHRPARYLSVFLVCEHHPALRLAICEVPLPIPRFSVCTRGLSSSSLMSRIYSKLERAKRDMEYA